MFNELPKIVSKRLRLKPRFSDTRLVFFPQNWHANSVSSDTIRVLHQTVTIWKTNKASTFSVLPRCLTKLILIWTCRRWCRIGECDAWSSPLLFLFHGPKQLLTPENNMPNKYYPSVRLAMLDKNCLHLLLSLVAIESDSCDPVDCSPPGTSIHGILQAGILQWVAMPSSRGSSRPWDRTQVSRIAGGFCTVWATRKALPPVGNIGKILKWETVNSNSWNC